MINRLIRVFQKEGDDFLSEVILKDVTLEELQKLFNIEKSNPMYDCYPVTEKQKCFLEGKANISIDLDSYDYFVEADEV